MPNKDIDPRKPQFRTVGNNPKTCKVIIMCSSCLVDIREMKRHESIRVDQGHYCAKCDTGTVIKNDA